MTCPYYPYGRCPVCDGPEPEPNRMRDDPDYRERDEMMLTREQIADWRKWILEDDASLAHSAMLDLFAQAEAAIDLLAACKAGIERLKRAAWRGDREAMTTMQAAVAKAEKGSP